MFVWVLLIAFHHILPVLVLLYTFFIINFQILNNMDFGDLFDDFAENDDDGDDGQ